MRLGWKVGIELELVAPRGSTRRSLADGLAASRGGRVTPFFHPQSELSLVPDVPVFENLTLGFDVHGSDGELLARYVDDLTLQDDLDRTVAPKEGWYRVVSDDTRFLALVRHLGRADGTALEAVAPVARVYGTEPEIFEDGTIRVTDDMRAPIVIAMPLPGERERPCEIVTAPLAHDHERRIDELLGAARGAGFTLAKESATHVHFDGTALAKPAVFQRLVRTLARWGPALKVLVGTNPACRRLGAWPDALHAVVEQRDFAHLDWAEARDRLSAVGLSKYCDFNLKNLVHDIPGKHTLEVRILPGMIDTAPVLASAALFEGILLACVDPSKATTTTGSTPGRPSNQVMRDPRELIASIPLDDEARRHWLSRVSA